MSKGSAMKVFFRRLFHWIVLVALISLGSLCLLFAVYAASVAPN